jgi:hypothetical protein
MASLIVPKRSLILPRGSRGGLVLSQHQRGFMMINPSRFGASGGSDPYFSSVVSLLHFDGSNGGTTFTDQKGKTWTGHGTAQTQTTTFKYGTAGLNLSQPNDYLDTSSHADFGFGTGDYTLECWARATNTAGRVNGLIDTRTASNTGIQLFMGGGAFGVPTNTMGCSSNAAVLATGGTVISGNWYHIALCRASGTIYAFVNGVQAFTVADSRTYASASTCFIGADYAGTTGQRFDGQIDDLRITKSVARYTSAFTPPTAAFPDS